MTKISTSIASVLEPVIRSRKTHPDNSVGIGHTVEISNTEAVWIGTLCFDASYLFADAFLVLGITCEVIQEPAKRHGGGIVARQHDCSEKYINICLR